MEFQEEVKGIADEQKVRSIQSIINMELHILFFTTSINQCQHLIYPAVHIDYIM